MHAATIYIAPTRQPLAAQMLKTPLHVVGVQVTGTIARVNYDAGYKISREWKCILLTLGGLLRSRYEYKYNHLQRSTEYRYNLPRIIRYLDLNTLVKAVKTKLYSSKH